MSLFPRFRFEKDRIFTVLVGIFLFIPLVFSPFTIEKFETVKLAIFSALLGFGLIFIFNKKLRYNSTILKLLSMFLIWSTVTFVLAKDKVSAFFGTDFLWFGFYFFVLWILFIFFLLSELNKEKLLFLLKVIVFVGVVNSICSILQTYQFVYNFFYSSYEIGDLVRAVGLIGNPNYTAMFLASLVIVAIYLWTQARDLKSKIYYGLSSFIMVWAIALLASRGDVLALVASLAFALALLFFSKNNWSYYKYLTTILILFFGFWVFLSPLIRDVKISNPSGISETNVVQRIDFWKDALDITRQHFFGVGFGNYIDVHNIFLNLLVIGGPLLLIIFLTLIFFILLKLWQKYKDHEVSKEEQWLDIVLLASLCGFFVGAQFNPVSLTLWILLALILSGLIFQTGIKFEKEIDLKFLPQIVGTLFIVFAVCFFTSQHFLWRGLRLNKQGQYDQSYKVLKWSKVLNPFNDILYTYIASDKLGLNLDRNQIITPINEINKIHPYYEWSYFRSGYLYYELYRKSQNSEDFELAVQNLEKSHELQPKFFYSDFQLAYYYYEAGDFDKASKFLREGIYNKSDYAQAWMMLANIYIKQGNDQAATNAITKAYEIILSNNEINQQRFTLKHILIRIKKGEKPPLLELNIPSSGLLF